MSTNAPSSSIITLSVPSKYRDAAAAADAAPAPQRPPADWLARTWTVTHSTLGMWRSAQNVHISYRTLPDDAAGRARNEDRVEYQSKGSNKDNKIKSVQGTNTASALGGFDWRGKGWLCFVTSHWEILGWGERQRADDGQVERWAVTWFAATLFTKEGLDYYSDRSEGLSSETAAALTAATDAWPAPLRELAKELQPVAISVE